MIKKLVNFKIHMQKKAQMMTQQGNQAGATTVEFLVAFLGVFVLLMLIVQVVLILINGIMVNHALALASQEAAARGGIDQTVDQVYISKLPAWLRKDCVAGGNCISSKTIAKNQNGITAPGFNECAARGQVFDVRATYTQDLFIAKIIGIDKPFVNMQRTLKVASQSLNPNSGAC